MAISWSLARLTVPPIALHFHSLCPSLNCVSLHLICQTSKDEKLSIDLGVTNDEVGRLNEFNECIGILDDTDFNSNLDECKLVNK